MQSTGGGGNGLNRQSGGGLTRYRSAPATWLDALLEADEENDTVLLDSPIMSSSSSSAAAAASISKQSLLPPPSGTVAASNANVSQSTQVCSVSSRFGSDLDLLDSLGSDGGGLTGLLRQNSSPAEFLSDGYFLSGFGVSGNYEYIMSSSLSLEGSEPPPKRAREADSDRFLGRANSPAVKIEQSGQLHGVLFDAEMEKLSEDAVLCKVRAKRGCATHPRSIAERVRRTRISDRIRKLQELVPNMDKQTNTADMLDEAVEYVVFLQKEIQELTEQQKKCKCFTKD